MYDFMIKTLCFNWITDIHSVFFYKNIFCKNSEAEMYKILRTYFKNKPEAEISKRMIILSDKNLKNMFLT